MLDKAFTPNLCSIEIEIITGCNLACFNCDRSARQAKSGEMMSVDQIQAFVDESIGLEWKWGAIRLLGGEPTLHPRLFEILQVLGPYRAHNPQCGISIHTNGHGAKVHSVLRKLPSWVKIVNSDKTGNRHRFSSYNVAPRDLPEFDGADYATACWIPESCGIGLTRYGYYSCGAGGSIDRVFGFDIGLKHLAEVTHEKLRDQLRLLCSYCGHFKHNDYARPELREQWVTSEEVSESWKRAYARYHEEKPRLTLLRSGAGKQPHNPQAVAQAWTKPRVLRR